MWQHAIGLLTVPVHAGCTGCPPEGKNTAICSGASFSENVAKKWKHYVVQSNVTKKFNQMLNTLDSLKGYGEVMQTKPRGRNGLAASQIRKGHTL